jgi:hypothetical protein
MRPLKAMMDASSFSDCELPLLASSHNPPANSILAISPAPDDPPDAGTDNTHHEYVLLRGSPRRPYPFDGCGELFIFQAIVAAAFFFAFYNMGQLGAY